MANDNRTPAGHLKNGVLELHLELRQGRWYPEDDAGAYRDIYAFAEAGRAPQVAGPLVRVPQGTQIHATILNTLAVPAKIYGLHRHPAGEKDATKDAATDALSLAPGETRAVEFLAGDRGTYFYWATTSNAVTLDLRTDAETLLSGAFIVDPPGTKPDDRIFVIGIWWKGDGADFQEIDSINGKSWPHTERLTYKLGETIHWRVINTTFSDHAMHLHGFFYTVDGEGDGERYQSYSPEQRSRVVTQHVEVARVFDMTWTSERAGNWLFHCHMMFHMSPQKSLALKETASKEPQPAASTSPSPHDHGMGMAGLVMGITVLPATTLTPTSVPASTAPARKLQLVISDNPSKIPLYNLELNDPLIPPAPDKKKSPSLLGPPIILTRGEATEIDVKNQSVNPTAIHWHGLELESYFDGVAGWTGSSAQTTPPIAPGTSFIAHMTPPRAGTFIYHTHWHDALQIRNGVYGPLIVLDPGQKYDPEHDRTFVVSIGKYDPFGFLLLLNGTPQPDGMELHTATRYRMRLINITSNAVDLRVRLMSKGVPVQWKVIARDGADLPPSQLKSSTADMGVTVGGTCDVEYQSDTPIQADLEIREPFPPTTLLTLPLKFVDSK
ncbi:MAG TPA: multicopper oxidase domain-containing protein [Terriglobales bacterium]|jgi:FtsP/CotA-like multicopper oxidase with cupredoxin domain|nr:multicopper oxidase domain-containing protein [Terriglobales bacterium]